MDIYEKGKTRKSQKVLPSHYFSIKDFFFSRKKNLFEKDRRKKVTVATKVGVGKQFLHTITEVLLEVLLIQGVNV